MTHDIEQLWAAQSTESGAMPIIQVASATLANNRSFMEQIIPYLSYALPPGSTPQTTLKDDAPISLSFFNIGPGGPGVLLYKSYAVQATDKQPGMYFIHVLTNLPAGFSAQHATLLWRSPFWEEAIENWLASHSKIIPPLSFDTFRSLTTYKFIKIDRQKINRYLPYVLRAHLLQQQMLQEPQYAQYPQTLYITAKTDEVAYLISALLSLIPQQFRKYVTFSTYEHDTQLDRYYLLLGTYSPSPKEFFINSTLANAPYLSPTNPLISYYARYTARCWEQDKSSDKLKELHKFFDHLKTLKPLNLDLFISEYKDIHNASDRTKEAITRLLKQPFQELIHTLANDEDARARLIDCTLIEGDAFLAAVTSQLAQISQNGYYKEQLIPLREDISNILLQTAETNNPDFFLVALSLLESLSLTSQVWINLLDKLINETQIIDCYWELRAKLLQSTNRLLSEEEQQHYWQKLLQLLGGIKREDLLRLLMLPIPSHWVFAAIASMPKIEKVILSNQEIEIIKLHLKDYRGIPYITLYLDAPGYPHIVLYSNTISQQQTPPVPKPPIQPPPIVQPPERLQPIHNQPSIDDFLRRPTFTTHNMRTLANVIYDQPEGTRTQFVPDIAKALVDCIEDAFQLSIAISTIGTVCGRDYSYLLLQKMVATINTLYRQSIQSASKSAPEFQRGRLLLAAYTHYTLEFIMFFYDNDQRLILILLQTLLQDVDTETFKFLNDASTTWPPRLQNQWHLVEQQLHPLPVQPPFTKEVDYKQFLVSVEEQQAYKDEEQRAIKGMQAALNKKGATLTLTTWLRHRITLRQHSNAIQLKELQRIEAAGAFSLACQQADASRSPDPATQQAIISAANDLQDNLTKREQKHVKRANQNAPISLSKRKW